MRWESFVFSLICSGTLLAAVSAGGLAAAPGRGPAPAPAPGADLSQAPASVMTGTVAERNAAIEKALADEGGKRQQIIFNEIDAAQALRFFSRQMKIDIALREEALAKVGVGPRLTVSIHLYDVTVKEALEAIRWGISPKEGGVAWKAEEGVLKLVPVAEAGRAVETEAEKKRDAAVKAALKKPMTMVELKDIPAPQALRYLAVQMQSNVVVDWPGLERAGVNKEAPLTMKLQGTAGEEALRAVVGAMVPKEGAAGYEVWGGLVRVGTRARLDQEKPVAAAAAPAGMP
jgi:hypothetical protein